MIDFISKDTYCEEEFCSEKAVAIIRTRHLCAKHFKKFKEDLKWQRKKI